MARDLALPLQQIGMYDLVSKIAEGGMGAVYRATSRVNGETVAIKVIPPETAKNPILMKRFEQEFKAASLLDHPNVVKAIEYCATGPSPFLVMEFVDGESLGQRVERDGPLPEAFAIQLMAQVCDGLHRAHKQGLIHRDVKPDNILVTRDGVAKLTDMGLVKDVEGELNLTKTGRGLGTPHFMAPEQFRNAKNADVKCDVYSLGATLYMILTGGVPFAKTSPLECWLKKTKNEFPAPRAVNPAVSERTDWAVRRAMSADPKERPASCREFMEDLTGQAWRTRTGTAPDSGAVAESAGPRTTALPGTPDLWYLVYKGADGEPNTVKGTTDSIRQNVKAGYLGDSGTILVCRTKTGQFVPLRSVPEFRDLVVAPAPVAATANSSERMPKPPSTGGIPGVTGPSGQPDQRPASDPAAQIQTDRHTVTPLAAAPVPATPPRRPAPAPAPGAPKSRTDWLPWAVVGAAILAATAGAFFLAR